MQCNHCLAEIDDRSESCPYCSKDPIQPPGARPATGPARSIPPIARQAASPSEPLQNLQLGLEAFKRQDLQAAAQHFLMAIRLQPQLAEALNAMGYIYFLKERYENAAELFQKAVTAAPRIPTFHYNLASTLFRLHQYQPGQEAARQALQLRPGYQKARQLLLYHQVTNQQPSEPLAQAQALIEENKAQDAVQLLTAFLSRNPTQAEAFALLGRAYAMSESEQIDDAIRAFEQSVRLEPAGSVFLQLGKLYARNRQFQYALAAFQRALEQDGENPDIYYSIGLTYEQAQEKAKALRAYQETFKRAPAHFNALYKIASLLKQLGYNEEARDAFNQLLELKPDHPAARRELEELGQLAQSRS